jgi:hypothetical protein
MSGTGTTCGNLHPPMAQFDFPGLDGRELMALQIVVGIMNQLVAIDAAC